MNIASIMLPLSLLLVEIEELSKVNSQIANKILALKLSNEWSVSVFLLKIIPKEE